MLTLLHIFLFLSPSNFKMHHFEKKIRAYALSTPGMHPTTSHIILPRGNTDVKIQHSENINNRFFMEKKTGQWICK